MVWLRQQGGVLSLIECTLIEEPDANDEDGESVSFMHIFKHISTDELRPASLAL